MRAVEVEIREGGQIKLGRVDGPLSPLAAGTDCTAPSGDSWWVGRCLRLQISQILGRLVWIREKKWRVVVSYDCEG